ncbi:DUF262 domain-containing protein [Butyrivibrio sp. TB]|uniref:DUF262 domain-containing protein n=1 Tax=Butyrivibrio sp. TB TaxID=1520809 RepID=UPI0008AEC8D4|nr:DUF262 domain-containing protein [Butyrivibrio sp. TB]SEQ33415.1 Uncharacterized conserved protein, contains ParB-like and HNH nuclease domains [Butyrivibrio sp. TB]
MKWESYSHPISDVKEWDETDRLELRPEFQRNEVWSTAAQIMLIDTILRGIPIPKIYIKSIVKNEKTYRVVIDGQQRLTAILKFVKGELTLNSPYNGPFEGKKFNDLPVETHNNFLRYKIDINEIFNPTEEEIRDLYSRVNKYTVQLNKQELRKADFPGDFIRLSEKLSESPYLNDEKIFTVKQRRRMLDVEFIEELLTVVLEGIKDKKDYLNDICEKYMVMDNKNEIEKRFNYVIEDISKIFDDNILALHSTRFKQKSDFYSLFSAIYQLHENAKLTNDEDRLSIAREKLKEMNQEIGPQSKNDAFLEYATRCLSDANSRINREWRTLFIKERISIAYEEGLNND